MEKLYEEWSDDGRIVRTSHALVAGGRVWLIDPVDEPGLDERVHALGEPAAVLQLLDRHNRDCAVVASRLGIAHRLGWELTDVPFTVLPVRRSRFWREVSLWDPETLTLVSPEMLGTVPQFLAPGERIGWHPLARPFPPRAVFEGLDPERILVGHGPALEHGATEALQDLLAHGRRRVVGALRALRTSGRAASTRTSQGR